MNRIYSTSVIKQLMSWKLTCLLLFAPLIVTGGCTSWLAEGHANRSNRLIKNQKYQEGLAEAERAIEADPGYWLGYNNKAAALIGLQRYYEAIKPSSRAIELAPNSSLPRYNLGLAYYSTGDFPGAIKELEEALSKRLRKNLTINAQNMIDASKRAKKIIEKPANTKEGLFSVAKREGVVIYTTKRPSIESQNRWGLRVLVFYPGFSFRELICFDASDYYRNQSLTITYNYAMDEKTGKISGKYHYRRRTQVVRNIWQGIVNFRNKNADLDHEIEVGNMTFRYKNHIEYYEFAEGVIMDSHIEGEYDDILSTVEEIRTKTKHKRNWLIHHHGVKVAGPQTPVSEQMADFSQPISKIRDTWAVIIGISRYRHSGRNGLANLIFANDDAKKFARVLSNLGWSIDHIKLLVDEAATQRNIMIALESWLTKAGPNDQIVLFWAGHGYPDPEDPEKVYFACYDTDISIPATGYRMDKVRFALEEKKARNVIILVDTCHAGKLITRGGRGISILPKINKMTRDQSIPKGWIFMVGADTDRQALEHTSWSNGAFTHCLLKALSGEADGYQSVGAKDGIVTMGELRAYLNSAMPGETQRILGTAKRPVITTSTGDPRIWNLTLQVQ